MPTLVGSPHELSGERDVRVRSGVAVPIEVDTELGIDRFVLFVPIQRIFLGAGPRFGGVDGNGGTVHVRPGDERRLLAERAERACVSVAADVSPKVADVKRAV